MRKFRVAVAVIYMLSGGPTAAMMLGSDEFERPLPQQARTRAEVLGSWTGLVPVKAAKLTLADLQAVNATANRIAYVSDIDNYGVDDHWATPDEFAARGGDCEDYAIAKYAMLKARGLAPGQMRIVVVRDLERQAAHAVLSVDLDGTRYILDNQSADVHPDTKVTRYLPIYSINETGWWLHMPRG